MAQEQSAQGEVLASQGEKLESQGHEIKEVRSGVEGTASVAAHNHAEGEATKAKMAKLKTRQKAMTKALRSGLDAGTDSDEN